MKEDILKLIDKKIKSLISYKRKLLDMLMINEEDEFALEQHTITVHQIYILEELKKDIKGE